MKGKLEKAFGYQGDNMNLPVRDLATALPFYETTLGFQVVSRSDSPTIRLSSAVMMSRSGSQKTAVIPPRTVVPFM